MAELSATLHPPEWGGGEGQAGLRAETGRVCSLVLSGRGCTESFHRLLGAVSDGGSNAHGLSSEVSCGSRKLLPLVEGLSRSGPGTCGSLCLSLKVR